MVNANKKNSNLHALLIGIDCYLPNKLPGGLHYPSLGGCVRDINHVENYLKFKVGLASDNILKLTSSNKNSNNGLDDNDKPSEPPEMWPTYENMVNAFEKIIKNAEHGDQLYIHYSGHGGRVPTMIPDKKGPDGLDETLVPLDIGNPENRYLRDVEIAKILNKIIDKKLVVTLVLDSCHSGGATRGRGGAAVRGTDIVDTTLRPQESLVASVTELADTWQNQHRHDDKTTSSKQVARDMNANVSGWLPDPKGYVLLAACRQSESAYEYAFEGDERNGALTYWLLKSLEQVDKGLTYKIVHDRLIAKIHSQFPLQTPILEGDEAREIFGSEHVQPVYAVNVMEVDVANKKVTINAGQAHGIRKGAKFALYPSGFTDFSQVDKRIAIVEVEERGAVNSKANIIAGFTEGKDPITTTSSSAISTAALTIQQGSQAVLINPVDIHIKRLVRLVYDNNTNNNSSSSKNNIIADANKEDLSSNQQKNDHIKQAPIDKIKNILIEEGKGFLELASENSDKAHYQVAINKEETEYEIWDPAGAVIPNLNPPLSISNDNSASKVVQRLVHLTKYSNVQQLDNLDSSSPLSKKLIVYLCGVSDNYEPGDNPKDYLQPLDVQGNINKVKVGQKLVLQIKNDSEQVLNIAVLDLQPGWGIKQVYPTSGKFIPIDQQREEYFLLTADLPFSYNEAKNIIKVFGTVDATDFRWLELASLDQPIVQRQRDITRGSSSGNPLEDLMALITKDVAVTRDINPSATPSKEWTTAQIEVQIHR